MSRHRSSVGLRWPSKRIAALPRLPIRSVWAARCALRCAPMASRSLRHLIGGATLVCGLLAGCASRPPAPDAVVSGVALTRERVLLPPEAVFEATLLDVTDPDRPPVVLGRQRRAPAGPAPYAIWIASPSAYFLPQGRYEVRASVTLQGRLLLASNRRHPVPQAPAWRHVDVLLERLRPQPATQQAAVPLTLTHWRLVAIDAETLPRPAEGEGAPHLGLQADEARAPGSGGGGGGVGAGATGFSPTMPCRPRNCALAAWSATSRCVCATALWSSVSSPPWARCTALTSRAGSCCCAAPRASRCCAWRRPRRRCGDAGGPVAGWRDPRRARAAAAQVARSAAAQIPTNYRAVSRSSASRYLAAVLSITAWGRRGAGGVLSQGRPPTCACSSQSRTNCLS